jgi:hypothetical protein
MTGHVAVTEGERELREFASRVLSYPYPGGPTTSDLIAKGYPDDLPPELVDYTDMRFLGSVVQRRDGELQVIELLFEMATGPNDLLERYERGLLDHGWQLVNQPGLHRGGFEGSGMPRVSVLVNVKKRTRVYIQSFEEGVTSGLRVRYSPPSPEELTDDLSPEAPPGRSPLPTLQAPAGVRMHSSGSGGGGGAWSMSAKAHTEMPPKKLESHLTQQLETRGWKRVNGSSDEFFAWSGWRLQTERLSDDWKGTLVILAASPDKRSLWFFAEWADKQPWEGYLSAG